MFLYSHAGVLRVSSRSPKSVCVGGYCVPWPCQNQKNKPLQVIIVPCRSRMKLARWAEKSSERSRLGNQFPNLFFLWSKSHWAPRYNAIFRHKNLLPRLSLVIKFEFHISRESSWLSHSRSEFYCYNGLSKKEPGHLQSSWLFAVFRLAYMYVLYKLILWIEAHSFHCTLEEKVILHSLNASHTEKQSTQINYRSLLHRISSSKEAGKISVRSIPENKTIGIHPNVSFLWGQNQS